MYKLSALLMNVALLASSVNAGKIYVCTGKNYTGHCTDVEFKSGECKNLPFGDGISSLRMFNYDCQFYTDVLCDPNSENTSITYDMPDLHTGTFNDQLSSFRC
ncbi:hypothetical protein IAQ61_002275 [Plenodomus lingam]|uniref:Predicted protein n=1 Tax=Leptosphaeria maculans (strain JN3 / isolate v23.1.3 / race Av1-4-5-6-7-8) TaxID=985895 RepID=E4ZID1_LEPMJ|nr:predicted protein [Plenodomus lingam JN3]KAH9876914.1 hypothetical protein IAQ61_002275 [Plenodomus lingam]CBX90792.1 predicted protein [Plenodomus lingam JN3]